MTARRRTSLAEGGSRLAGGVPSFLGRVVQMARAWSMVGSVGYAAEGCGGAVSRIFERSRVLQVARACPMVGCVVCAAEGCGGGGGGAVGRSVECSRCGGGAAGGGWARGEGEGGCVVHMSRGVVRPCAPTRACRQGPSRLWLVGTCGRGFWRQCGAGWVHGASPRVRGFRGRECHGRRGHAGLVPGRRRRD